jgi:hypothetical protein
MHFLSFNGVFGSHPLRESGMRFVKKSCRDRGVHVAIPFACVVYNPWHTLLNSINNYYVQEIAKKLLTPLLNGSCEHDPASKCALQAIDLNVISTLANSYTTAHCSNAHSKRKYSDINA